MTGFAYAKPHFGGLPPHPIKSLIFFSSFCSLAERDPETLLRRKSEQRQNSMSQNTKEIVFRILEKQDCFRKRDPETLLRRKSEMEAPHMLTLATTNIVAGYLGLAVLKFTHKTGECKRLQKILFPSTIAYIALFIIQNV